MKPHHRPALSQAQILEHQGTAHLIKGQYFQALVALSAAVHQDPNLASAHNNRGIALAHMEELHQAVDNFNAALRLDPANIQAHLNRGIAEAKLGLSQQSIHQLTDLRSQHPWDLEIRHALSYLHSIALHHHRAEYHHTTALDPKNILTRYYAPLDCFHPAQLFKPNRRPSQPSEAPAPHQPPPTRTGIPPNTGVTWPKRRRS